MAKEKKSETLREQVEGGKVTEEDLEARRARALERAEEARGLISVARSVRDAADRERAPEGETGPGGRSA